MSDLYHKSLGTLVTRCLEISRDTPVVFFVGSGVSTVYPSILPSAWEMVTETVEAVVPTKATEEEKELVKQALPEIYYEFLADVVGDNAITVWEALHFWRSHTELSKFNLGPNSGHLLLVYLAWQGGVPIITTNFDTLLEEARKKLQLNANEVEIWHVHGTIDDLASIQTTLRTIAAADWEKLNKIRKQFERNGADVCLIGYSGRDIDLFPHIAGWPLEKRLFWLDRNFSDHLIHQQLDQFTAVVGKIEDFVKEIIKSLKNNDVKVNILKQSLEQGAQSQEYSDAPKTYKRLIRQHINDVFENLLPTSDPRRLLIHAVALSSIGEYKLAQPHVGRFIEIARDGKGQPVEPRLLGRAFLLQSSLAHELSHYEDSQQFAEEAKKMACNNDLRSLEAEAVMASDEALRMQHLPKLNFRNRIHFLQPPAWKVLFRFAVHVLTLCSKVRHNQRLEPDVIRARFTYTEHLVRLGAIVQAGLSKLFPRPFIRFFMKLWWHPIEFRSYELGYAHGIANARKYAERLGIAPRTSPIISANILYKLLSAKTGKAIHHRDRAERLAEEATRAKTDKQQTELWHQAIRELDLGYQEATAAGNVSLILKILITRRHLQKDFRANRAEVDALLRNIQGVGYKLVAKDLINWLCEAKGENHERSRTDC